MACRRTAAWEGERSIVSLRARVRHDARHGLELVIRDFGRGFDRDREAARAQRDKSLGLLSMGERAALIGGMLPIDSTVGCGSVVRAQLPLPAVA